MEEYQVSYDEWKKPDSKVIYNMIPFVHHYESSKATETENTGGSGSGENWPEEAWREFSEVMEVCGALIVAYTLAEINRTVQWKSMLYRMRFISIKMVLIAIIQER